MKSGNLEDLTKGSASSMRIQRLLARPRHLLATLLIANNLFNISIVIVSYQLFDRLMPGETEGWVAFLLNSVVVTFVIVIFGESLPKVFANSNQSKVIQFAAIPISILDVLFRPISSLLVMGSRFFDRWMKNPILHSRWRSLERPSASLMNNGMMRQGKKICSKV